MDIASVSSIVAACGVMVGIAFAYLEIRSLVRTRQTDMVIRLYSSMTAKEWMEAWEKVNEREKWTTLTTRKRMV